MELSRNEADSQRYNAVPSIFSFAGAQRLGPRDPMGPKGGPFGPLGPLRGPRALWGPWGLFRSHFEWMAITNGRSFRLDVTSLSPFKLTFSMIWLLGEPLTRHFRGVADLYKGFDLIYTL